MPKPSPCLLVLLALATPAWAQGQGGPSDMTPRGTTFIGSRPNATPLEAGAGIATPGSRGDVSAQPGTYGNMTKRQLHDLAETRRADALRVAGLVSSGRQVPPDFRARLVDAVKGDLALWRAEYGPDKADWKAMNERFSADRATMTASDWALRRAEWFAARDQWIAAHR